MEEIASEGISRMVDSTSAALLAELDRKRKRWRALPFTLVASVILLAAVGSAELGPIVFATVAVPLALASAAAYYWDLLKKSVVIMYDLDDEATGAYQGLHDAVGGLGQASAAWHISARGDVRDPKYHAGAGHLVRRKGISILQYDPPFVRTNIAVYRVPTASGSLYFCPDAVLYYASDGVGAISYDDLRIEFGTTRFIEEGSVPRDARIVDRTWRYVNKKGGPDRRFKDNRELPVCEYEEIHLRSNSGLNELLQVSMVGLGEVVLRAAGRMAEELERARRAPVTLPDETPPPIRKPQPAIAHSVQVKLPAVTPRQPVKTATTSTTVVLDGAPSLAEVYEALFRILCCVMVADGRASSSEKARIGELMKKSGASWDSHAVAEKITAFIAEIQTGGFKATLAAALARVRIFQDVGRPDILLRCIDSLIAVDGDMANSERTVVELIRKKLNESAA